jgi:hypothetical protein
MFMELKRLADLRSSELGQVTAPFYAVGQLKNARAGYTRIRGFETAWESYTDHHGPWDWNHRERGFERLRQAVEQGDWVLVLDKNWPPISPAFQEVNGQWEASPQAWPPAFRDRLGARTQTLEREQREWEALQSRSAPPAPKEIEPAQGPGNRQATLGPHAETTGEDVSNKQSVQTASTFKSQDAAAKAALEKANPLSIQDNLEYGGLIYRNKTTGEYGYTGPIKGSDQGVNPFNAPVPAGCELVGDFHTHADYSIVDRNTGAAIRTGDPKKDDFNSDNFSSTDMKGIKAVGSGKPGYKGYLGTPSGAFKVYDPATGAKGTL